MEIKYGRLFPYLYIVAVRDIEKAKELYSNAEIFKDKGGNEDQREDDDDHEYMYK